MKWLTHRKKRLLALTSVIISCGVFPGHSSIRTNSPIERDPGATKCPVAIGVLFRRVSAKDESIKGEGEMRKVLGGFGLVALVAFSALAVPVMAQKATGVKKAHLTPFYDATKEVTLQGTVENVLRTPSRGMLPGSHIMLATASGVLDTHLGPFAFKGYKPLNVEPGSRVEVVGVMKTIRSNQVFLARKITVGQEEYNIRNEHGVILMPVNPEIGKSKTTGGAR